MADHDTPLNSQPFQSSLFFETAEELYRRVFRELKPRTPLPEIKVRFCQFANADSFIRFREGCLEVRISDLLEGAPSPVLEALAHILLGKLYRKPAARAYAYRYRLYLNRRDVRRQAHIIRQARGRKYLSGPQGELHDLAAIFDRLNIGFFDGLLARPLLGWSRTASRAMLGHFDPSHNAIVISRIFDRAGAPLLALEYVVFHEMLHLRYPADHSGSRRRVHTKEFREAEKKYPGLEEAMEALKRL